MFWKRSVQLAMTGFGNVVAPCIARKSRKTASKNPTYSDRVFCGGLDETPTEHLLFSHENISYKITHE